MSSLIICINYSNLYHNKSTTLKGLDTEPYIRKLSNYYYTLSFRKLGITFKGLTIIKPPEHQTINYFSDKEQSTTMNMLFFKAD
jgi:hypothetical protein